MPDENKRPITRKPSSQETSTIIRRNSASGLSLPVALSFFFVIMLIATVWSAAQLSLSWPFLILFTCASLSVVTFTRFEGLFLATCSVPIFFGLFSVAAGWLISELQTTTDTRGATSLVASVYPFVQHFPVLLITALGVVIIAVFRWTSVAHKVTAAAERGQRERKQSHISNARLSQQSAAARRLNTDSLRAESDFRQEHVRDHAPNSPQTSERPAGFGAYRRPSTSSGQAASSTHPASDSGHKDTLGLGNQRSLQGSTQVPLLIDGKKPHQDYAGGIVSRIPRVGENPSPTQPRNYPAPGSQTERDSSLYTPTAYGSDTRGSQLTPPKFYSGSSEADLDSLTYQHRDIDREIDDLARGNFGDLATPNLLNKANRNRDDEYEGYSRRNPDPVYPQFRSSFTLRKKPSKHTTDTGQIDVSDILNREQRPD